MKSIIRPKNRQATNVGWKISEHARDVVKYFAEYSEYTEEEIVEQCILLLMDDEGFQDWIADRRFNKMIVRKVYSGDHRDKILPKLEAKEEGA